jgi:hypothetical protein
MLNLIQSVMSFFTFRSNGAVCAETALTLTTFILFLIKHLEGLFLVRFGTSVVQTKHTPMLAIRSAITSTSRQNIARVASNFWNQSCVCCLC